MSQGTTWYLDLLLVKLQTFRSASMTAEAKVEFDRVFVWWLDN